MRSTSDVHGALAAGALVLLGIALMRRHRLSVRSNLKPSSEATKPKDQATHEALAQKSGCCTSSNEPCACTAFPEAPAEGSGCCNSTSRKALKVFYGSVRGTAKRFASRVAEAGAARGYSAMVQDLQDYDPDCLGGEGLAIFILATYTEGVPTENARAFVQWIREMDQDFRVSRQHLAGLRFAIFGCGNSEYKDHFNTVGKQMDAALEGLGASRAAPRFDGDNIDNALPEQFDAWLQVLWAQLEGGGAQATAQAPALQEESDSEEEADTEGVVDIEDMGGAIQASKQRAAAQPKEDSKRKKMVTPSLSKHLTKQGYKIIGSHSGVKLCRWTKAMLRGRGGCYKHTFYGIASHLCMEMTPSLACANKCIFCWRHHDNPVGTEFRWQVDDPQMLIEGALNNHRKMINECRGIPGVLPERLEEGMKPRHCALSLVGEPIMYPHISQFMGMLHDQGISSFMVTNAQFPEELEKLQPVTQLYLSIDAATKEELKAIDRPIFPDFWERFLKCQDVLREKRQRTVYRLTLVNGWNIDTMKEYAALIRRGDPDFVEIKGVTYCGDSKASPLTIKNCPFHEEVRTYSQQLADMAGGYGVASEHAHSNCMLLAKDCFKIDGIWHTWINFDKFTELTKSGEPFTTVDYMLPTPHWAQFDPAATDGGFDPAETRYVGKGGKLVKQSGC